MLSVWYTAYIRFNKYTTLSQYSAHRQHNLTFKGCGTNRKASLVRFRSELESYWSLHFYFRKIVEKNESNKKYAGVGTFKNVFLCGPIVCVIQTMQDQEIIIKFC